MNSDHSNVSQKIFAFSTKIRLRSLCARVIIRFHKKNNNRLNPHDGTCILSVREVNFGAVCKTEDDLLQSVFKKKKKKKKNKHALFRQRSITVKCIAIFFLK